MKISTLAAAIGIIAGLWTAWFNWVEYVGRLACSHEICTVIPGTTPNILSNPTYYEAVFLVSVLLIVSSAICLFGLKVLLYLSLALSIILAATSVFTLVLVGIVSLPYSSPTLALSTASAISSAMAARSRTSLPPGSHPMDLPVFG